MSEVFLSRRVVHFVLLTGLTLFFVSCACFHRGVIKPVPFDERYAGCRSGAPNLNSPVACVDVATLAVSPEPVMAFDRDSRNTSRPVQVIWLASDNRSDLRIQAAPGCVENVFCNGRGLCRATTVDVSKETSCKYTVRIGHRVNDPIVITVPCCMYSGDTEVAVP